MICWRNFGACAGLDRDCGRLPHGRPAGGQVGIDILLEAKQRAMIIIGQIRMHVIIQKPGDRKDKARGHSLLVPTQIIAAATLAAGLILVVVVLHMLAN